MYDTHNFIQAHKKQLEAILIKMGYLKEGEEPQIDWTSVSTTMELKDGERTYRSMFKETNSPFSKLDHKIHDKPEIFLPVYARIGVRKYKPTTTANNVQNGKYPLYTYNDLAYFNGPGESDSLMAVWNGQYDFMSDDDLIWKDRNSNRHYFVPPVQFDPAAAVHQLPSHGGAYEERGWEALYQHFVLKGDKDQEVIIRLGEAPNYTAIDGAGNTAAGAAGTTRNGLVFEMMGFHFRGTFGASSSVCPIAPVRL